VAYGGLDLASTSDLNALCWLFPAEVGFDAIWRFWTPEANLASLDKRTAGAALTLLPQGRPLSGTAPRQQQRTRGVLAKT